MTDPQYPIGKFVEDPNVTPEKRQRWIEEIAGTAELFRKAVARLAPEQLDTPYLRRQKSVGRGCFRHPRRAAAMIRSRISSILRMARSAKLSDALSTSRTGDIRALAAANETCFPASSFANACGN